ncbi:unnamed protein product [Rotaria sp. Silwood1]|nr:unnamed protein product [Rotaria sp. Silwood1]CAF5006720.1 unnamed protein product [Rotaria sp. Silwood1]
MDETQVAEYESGTSDEEVIEEQRAKNTKKKIKKQGTKFWIKEKTFNNADEATASIKKEWSKHYTNHTQNGRRIYYRCRKSKRRGVQCSAGICLLYHSDSDKVTMYKTEAEHDHVADDVHGIDLNVKQCIEELYKDGITKPKLILRALQSRQLKVPTYAQLNNYLAYYKRKKYGSYTISLGELDQWCQNNSNVPTDENQAFVVSYKILYDDEDEDEGEDDTNGNVFRLFISSVRLLNIGSAASHINADATYKLVWQGFPVLIVGTTDLNKTLHPFGLAVCSNEKTKDFEFIFNAVQIGMQKINKDLLKPEALICDAADAIKNGFRRVFGNSYDQIMCWSHMKRNIENRICHINDKDISKEMLEDIEMVQLCNSSTLFKLATTLFMKKWNYNNKEKNQSVLDFLQYFDDEWLKSNSGWYEGIRLYTPSTNNALESTNRTIKDDGTFRERHMLSRFLTIASDIVRNWSIDRDPSSANPKQFATEPTITLQLWTSSYQWAKSNKKINCISNDSTKIYYIPARQLQSFTQTDLNRYKKQKFTTFNQFQKSFDIWCVEMQDNSHWKTSICNCPAFLKNYICKHVVGMSIRLKYCKPPPAAKTVPIGQKRRRGRPAKAKPALLVQ